MRALLVALVGWTLVGLVSAGQAYLSSASTGAPPPPPKLLVAIFESVWLWALLTPAMLQLARRFPVGRSSWRRHMPLHAAFALALAAVDAAVDWVVLPLFFDQEIPLLSRFARELTLNLLSYAAVVAVGHALTYHRLYRDRRLREVELEAQLLEARLHALQLQLQPHFLFNALHTVASLVRTDRGREATQVLARLGELLRMVLESPETQEVELRGELALVERYLAIEEARFCDRFSCAIDAEPAVLDALVPRLVLQPLVENAVRHGIEPRPGPGRVDVSARRAGDRLRLEIRDSGVGPATSRAGVGLANTQGRLRCLYGDDFSLELVAAEGGGACAVVEIPLRLASAARAVG